MKHFVFGLMAALVTSSSAFAVDADNDSKWMLRGRALGVIPSEDSNISPIGGRAEVDNSIVPELDVTYFFTPNIAAELIAAVTPHDVKAKGTALGDVDVGDSWLLPPTLTLQYHFTQFVGFKPYVGAGLNYTVFFNEDPGALNSVKYDNSFGGALQAGVDIPIQGNWYANIDVKKVWIDTTAHSMAGRCVPMWISTRGWWV